MLFPGRCDIVVYRSFGSRGDSPGGGGGLVEVRRWSSARIILFSYLAVFGTSLEGTSG